MNIDEQKKFTFIKEYRTEEGTIPIGSDLIIFRGGAYLNGGMIHPAYQSMMMKIATDKDLSKEYLKQVPIIQNKV